MIQLNQVSKTYLGSKNNEKVVALRDISLTIENGEIFGIVGHSGAGKSTLLRLLNGLEKPTTGSVMIQQQEISNLDNKQLRQVRQKIGMIFQHFHLLWSRTVRENIAFPLEIIGLPKEVKEQKVTQLLKRVGLVERADAYPSQLSGGEKQRVGIARALANDPTVLLCDEATSALDPETTQSILQLLQEINRDTGITLVLITHEMSVVRSICDRVAVMEAGQIVELGLVKEVFSNPKHPVTRKFLQMDSHRQEDRLISIELENANEWGNLVKIAQDYRVSLEIVSGRIEAGSKRQTLVIRLIGQAADVEKARAAISVPSLSRG
jgi:D-methionine transport system ATP-binding protein